MAGIPGMAAGVFLILVPLLGARSHPDAWKGALPWILPGLILVLGKRGVSVDPATRGIRLWAGIALTRFLVLPLWRRRPRTFRTILIRQVGNPPPRGGISPRQPAVYLVDAEDRWSFVGRTWTHRGAVRMAERLARLSGLPVG